ncbi:MAG: hypothetical protein ACI837_002888 [Crocinitomicaceae bacterium]|jgi:hypothetical protein
MKLTTILFFFLLAGSSWSQDSYADIQDEFVRYCGHADTSTLMKNVAFVDSVAQIKGVGNEEKFLIDYGQAYYAKYLLTKERTDLIVSNDAFARCWEHYGNTNMLYSIALGYAAYDCFMARKYLLILEEIIENGELDFPDSAESFTAQIKMVRDFVCPE